MYPGRWMYPSAEKNLPRIAKVSTATVKSDKTYQWFLHDCKVTGKVCLEPKRSGWEDSYYVYYTFKQGLTFDTNLEDGSNED